MREACLLKSAVKLSRRRAQAVDVKRCFIASVIAGFAAAPVAAVLWLIVVISIYGGFDGDVTAPLGIFLVVAFFALIGGLGLALLVGFPLLVLAERFHVNRMPLMAAAGSVIPVGLGFVVSWPPEAWPLYLYLSVIGAACGALASHAARPRRCPK